MSTPTTRGETQSTARPRRAAYGQNMTPGRNGIVDDGRGGFSRVHSKTGLFWYDAFWSDDCYCMTYTSGMSEKQPALIGVDVAGHEMTHGVTCTIRRASRTTSAT